MFKSLQHKTAVITGAAQGIGKEAARVMLSYGCNVALMDIQKDKLEAVKKEFSTMERLKFSRQTFPTKNR
jgi:short-subunit dehydrogenase